MDNTNKPITFHWMWRRHWQINDSIKHLDFSGILRMAQELDGANVKSVLLPYGPDGIDFSLVIQEALQKTNGKLFPFGIYHILKAKQSKKLNFYLLHQIYLYLIT